MGSVFYEKPAHLCPAQSSCYSWGPPHSQLAPLVGLAERYWGLAIFWSRPDEGDGLVADAVGFAAC